MAQQVINVTAHDWNGGVKKITPKKGLQDRLSLEKDRATAAQVQEKLSSAELRRTEDLVMKSAKASNEIRKVEIAQIKAMKEEAELEAAAAIKHAQADRMCMAYQNEFEDRVARSQQKREQVRLNAQSEQARADRAKAEIEASVIPVHEIPR